MNNKAVTIPLLLAKELIECSEKMKVPGGWMLDELRAASTAAVDCGLEIQRWEDCWGLDNFCREAGGGDYVKYTDYCAHVGMLQAESRKFKWAHDVVLAHHRESVKENVEYVESLQSELTKARELIDEENSYVTVLLEALKDVLNWMDGSSSRAALKNIVDKALSNQSAPADKGQNGPVAWAMKSGLARISVNPKASHAVFGHSGEPGWDAPLYAEQPAPVAVVMPERNTDNYGSFRQVDYAQGWNACLDEVGRLNGVRP